MPGLLSNPVCLTVIWFLSWSLHPSYAQIWTDEVSDVQYGRLDSNVTLACGKSQIRTPVVWHHNHSSVFLWHQVTSNGSLSLFHVDQSAQGNYSCYDDSGLLLHSVTLRLGYPPGQLSISCQVPNHTHVRCSWRQSIKTFLPAKYNASIRGKEGEWRESRPCIVDLTNKHCDVQDPSYWQTIHRVGVTETNALGSHTDFVAIRLSKLLKPDPPQAVSVQEVEGYPTKLRVSWKNPTSWPDDTFFPLLFQVRYRPQGSHHWSEISTTYDELEISDALAGHSHQVQVRARDDVDSESQWSEWSHLSVLIPWQATYTTPDPSEDPTFFNPFSTESAATYETRGLQGDEGNLGLVILLVLFSIFILTTVLSLIFVIWLRQKRHDHATKQELASMVKMKSIPI
ncbi:interleukin-11 receptor subunit alpha [Cyprinodon tularosa]|uniref:interleukin-11 receptor subunit alpha n=1 Tax=Cyprinodon tularosa TaxID=77115 RepID=UPI0018E21622|nr:interleukin-11 receptor subunit alpha [Cyprinodon tularosa]